MGMRIHEIKKIYKLNQVQLNDFLSNIGYTGNTNNLVGLPDNIIDKIEKHFVTKSSLSDSERRLYTGIRIIEARKKYNLSSKQMNDLLYNLGYTGSINPLAGLPYNIIDKIEKHFAAKSSLSDSNIIPQTVDCSTPDVNTYLSVIKELESSPRSEAEKVIIKKGCLADLSAKLEELLDAYGAKGNGLGKKLQSVRNDLSNDLRKTISDFNNKRIKIHEKDFSLSSNEMTEAIELANNAIIQLKELVKNGEKAGNTASNPIKQNKEIISLLKKEENSNNSENNRNSLDLKQTTDLYNTQNVVHSSSKSTTEVNHNTFCENLDEREQFRPISNRTIVTGTVIDKNNRGIYVDLGYKSDGLVPIEEFEQGEIDKFNVGDPIKVYVKKIDDKQGQVQLSYRIAREQSSWDELEEAYKNKTPVEGTLKESIKGGYNVTVLGNRAFLPQRLLSHGKNTKENIGKPFQMIITEFNRKRKNIVVSERANHEVIRNKKFYKYHVGDIIIGKVKKIVNYGVFVELEEDVDGLLHNSNISSYQKEILEEGQTVKVQILKIDSEKHRFSLGLEQNSYSDKKNEYAIDSDYKEIDMVDFLIDNMQWLNKKILIKNFPLKYCKGFRLSIKNFIINYNSDYTYCSFDGLDKEKIKELNNIFNHFDDYYNKSIKLYCVVQKGYVTGEDVSKNQYFLN